MDVDVGGWNGAVLHCPEGTGVRGAKQSKRLVNSLGSKWVGVKKITVDVDLDMDMDAGGWKRRRVRPALSGGHACAVQSKASDVVFCRAMMRRERRTSWLRGSLLTQYRVERRTVRPALFGGHWRARWKK
jgi:hypothetical protein